MSNHPSDPTIYVEKTEPQARQKPPPANIQGWGADLDPQARPAVPMERTPPRLDVPWDAPAQQARSVKVFHSIERPGLTPVYGTTVPPSGVSGLIRAGAFRYSESDLRHWLMLLFADRVNVVEGVIDDLAHGHVPDIFGEMGMAAEWKYNRAGFVRKAAVVAAIAGLLAYAVARRRR